MTLNKISIQRCLTLRTMHGTVIRRRIAVKAYRGATGFHEYFTARYGHERWANLVKALQAPPRVVARICGNDSAASIRLSNECPSAKIVFGGGTGYDSLPICFSNDDVEATRGGLPFPTPPVNDVGLREYYPMDLSSVLAACLLGAQKGEVIVDVCSAPGGKALILAESIGLTGTLLANDVSSSRRIRLAHVLSQHLPAELRARVTVSGIDACRLHSMRRINDQVPDRILVDAPCSSERHLLSGSAAARAQLAEWSTGRMKRVAGIQKGILSSALMAVKKGGAVLYTTCSISETENDAVVRKILKRKGDSVRVLDWASRNPSSDLQNWQQLDSFMRANFQGIEETEFGLHILPDKCHGYGPMYICCLLAV